MVDAEMLQAMKELIEPLKQGLSEVQQGQKNLEQGLSEVKQDLHEVHLILENTLPKQIHIIAEQHGDIIRRLDSIADYGETKSRLSTVELALKIQADEISDLKKRVG